MFTIHIYNGMTIDIGNLCRFFIEQLLFLWKAEWIFSWIHPPSIY